jgi:DNA-binding LacI/PurR family transcriptional regulator
VTFDVKNGARRAQIILTDGQRSPTAVFAADDSTTRGLVDGLQDGGAHVPDDYFVVGFDAAPMEQMLPELTTLPPRSSKSATPPPGSWAS